MRVSDCFALRAEGVDIPRSPERACDRLAVLIGLNLNLLRPSRTDHANGLHHAPTITRGRPELVSVAANRRPGLVRLSSPHGAHRQYSASSRIAHGNIAQSGIWLAA